ncbi:hypothetical protein DMUE_4160 [Dictyocoela muelleri]|nr:hypothetical protein DMUE_4160 [Dictyocoela muelleri]
MVRNTTKEIVNPEKIYTDKEILNLKITESSKHCIFSSDITRNVFLARLGLLCNTMICQRYKNGVLMSYVKRKSSCDGYHWVCKRSCCFSCNLRNNSVFSGTRLTMKYIF